MKIRFMSSNKHKIAEVQRILAPVGVDIIAVSQKIQELQTEDVYALVKADGKFYTLHKEIKVTLGGCGG